MIQTSLGCPRRASAFGKRQIKAEGRRRTRLIPRSRGGRRKKVREGFICSGSPKSRCLCDVGHSFSHPRPQDL